MSESRATVDTLNVDGEGDCYEAAVDLMFALPAEARSTARLCHGTALGNGGEALGLRYGHAWVEQELMPGVFTVRDTSNGLSTLTLRARYYDTGTIEDVRRYTYGEMLHELAGRKHYGPWR